MLQMIHPEHDQHLQPISGSSNAFAASEHSSDGKTHLLLAASGSVASIKIPNILRALSQHHNLSIRVILTKSASHFLDGQAVEQPHIDSLRKIPNVDGVFLDEDEWVHPWKRGNTILHIELRRWAHILVIAPLSANTLAKIVGGFADNLLTSVVRAWDTTGTIDGVGEVNSGSHSRGRKRIIVCPAMNTAMWRQPITKSQIRVLEEEWGVCDEGSDLHYHSIVGDGASTREGWFEVLRPMEKELACGDVGEGAMVDWREIVKVIEMRLHL